MRSRDAINLPDSGALVFSVDAILADVAVRPDARVQLRAVDTRDQILRPMMIDRAGGQGREHGRRTRRPERARRVADLHDGIAVGDVQRVADERHPERRIEMIEKDGARLGHAIAAGVPEQRYTIRARYGGSGLLLEVSEEPALDAFAVVGPIGGRVGFGDEDVAVR